MKPKGPRPKATCRAARKKAADSDDPLKADFRNFLALIWRQLQLPVPSPVQLSLAWWLQHGPSRAVILGFRRMAKSWITRAFILWTLYCDAQKKIMVVSASLDRAVQTVQWCLALIRSVPELAHLQPGALQRQSGKQFDVGPALPDQSPSLRGAGITGQITGSRAHLLLKFSQSQIGIGQRGSRPRRRACRRRALNPAHLLARHKENPRPWLPRRSTGLRCE